MYQFRIKRTIPELEAMIARDCIQRRKAPGYFWRDFRGIVRLQTERDPIRWKQGKPPYFFMGDVRYFRYELVDQGDHTSVTGQFVIPLGSLLFFLLPPALLVWFMWPISVLSLLKVPIAFIILLAGYLIWCLLYSFNLAFFPGKRTRDKLKRAVLEYFATLEREYPVR